MNLKIKVMPKERVAAVGDAEIRGLMDFDGLVIKAGRVAYGAKILANLKLITGSLAAVSVSAILIWSAQDNGVSTPEKSTFSEQSTVPPAENLASPTDSVIPPTVVPAPKLRPMNLKPKKESAQLDEQETKASTPSTPQAPASSAVYHEAEPVSGFPDLYEYFARELKYPEEGIKDSVQGVVIAAFVITSSGQVGKITLMNSLGPAFDAEAIRLISNMPAWRPATIDGKPAASRFSIPLNFQFNRNKKQ